MVRIMFEDHRPEGSKGALGFRGEDGHRESPPGTKRGARRRSEVLRFHDGCQIIGSELIGPHGGIIAHLEFNLWWFDGESYTDMCIF